MPTKLIKYSFAAGVFARALHGRDDLEKYDLALADADNFFIDYGGAATSRAGFEFADQLEDATAAVRFCSFRFNRSLANNYLIVFTDSKIRFVQNGAYVLEADVVVSSIVGNVVTANAHGYSTGDFVVIAGRTFVITVTGANTFTTAAFNGAAANPDSSAVVAARVYTVTSTYTEADLPGLQFRQRRDQVIITSLDFAPMVLTRSGHTSWALTAFDYASPAVGAPGNIAGNASTAGSASVNFTVTAVDQEGRETVLQSIRTANSIVDYANDPGSLRISWDAVPGAAYYNIYRSLIFPTVAQNSVGQQLGYIGRSYGTSFTDVNTTPAFNITPLQSNNPFLPGRVLYLEVTNGGSGYTSTPSVSISGGGGSGFVGLAIVESGAVDAIIVLREGSGYSTPVVSITGGGGSGATATATLGDSTGIYPQCSIFYGQRLWFLGTTTSPLALFSGRGDNVFSFNQTQYGTAQDPYEYEIESSELTPIKFAEALQSNLFVFTDQGVWQVAPAENGEGYASTQRTQNGIGRVRPLPVNTELVFALADGAGVWTMRPGTVPNTYTDADLAIFSGDFFTPEKEIVSWDYCRNPYRIVWAAKLDGKMLSFTYLPEHNVYAWAPHSTRGRVLEVASVLEDGIDRLYICVVRDGGVFIERMAHRDFKTPEDIWSVDAGLENTLTAPAANLTITLSSDGETATCVADAGVFSSGDVGAHLRAGGGRGVVTAYTSATTVSIQIISDITDRRPQQDIPPIFAEGEWTLMQPTNIFGGLHHLVGETVQVFGDGSYIGDYVVAADGSVTLGSNVSRAIIGLGFDGYVETLPPSASDAIITDRRKSLVGIALRLDSTRGVVYGSADYTYPMNERTTERYGEPTRFQNGLHSVSIRTDWNTNGSFKVYKEGPSAITLLGYVIDVDIGDDPD